MNAKSNALIVLAKCPKPSHVKTRLIPALGEIGASHLSELFLVDLLRRFFDIDRFENLLMFYNWQIFLEDSGETKFYCPETMKYLKSLTLP